MNFTQLFDIMISKYGGIGVLIVCVLIICSVIVTVGLPIIINKMFSKNTKTMSKDISETLTKGILNIGDTLTNTLKEQNMAQQELLSKIVDKLPDSRQEKIKHDEGQTQRFDISNDINALLLLMLNKYHATRVCVLEFHNGGTNIGGLPFVKYNMEYEQIKPDVKILGRLVRDLPASNIAPIISDLNDGTSKFKVYYKADIENLKTRSTVLYSHLSEINTEYIIYSPLYDSANIMIGLCAIEYMAGYDELISDDIIFNKLVETNKLDIHDNMIKISNYLDFKKKHQI